MKGLGIAPDGPFAETYLTTVLLKSKQTRWKVKEMILKLQQLAPDRITAARQALEDFKSAGVSLSLLSRTIDRTLKQL